MTVNYEIFEYTETLIDEYNVAGLVDYHLKAVSDDFRFGTKEDYISIIFDLETSINQTWNFSSYKEVEPGGVVKTIQVNNFLAPIIYIDEYDQIKNTVITQIQKLDDNIDEEELFSGSISGEFVSSFDGSIWAMKSSLIVDAASDTTDGFLNLTTENDDIGGDVVRDNITLSYNREAYGSALFHDVFEKHLVETPTTWTLMTYLREQIGLVINKDNALLATINDDLDIVKIEFSAELQNSSVTTSEFDSSRFLDIEHNISNNELSFSSASLPGDELFLVSIGASSNHTGSDFFKRYAFDRLNRGYFVSVPNVKSYIPSSNTLFGSENFEMFTFSIDGIKNNSRNITTIIDDVCISRITGNIFANDGASDTLLEINPNTLEVIDSHLQMPIYNTSKTPFNINSSPYCKQKYYIQNGNAPNNPILEYDFATKTINELSFDRYDSGISLIPHPVLERSLLARNDVDGYPSKVEVIIFSNIYTDVSKQVYEHEDTSYCSEMDKSFLYADIESMRLYTCNYVLSLSDPEQVIYEFDKDSDPEHVFDAENIILVDPDSNLIVTSKGIYDAISFELQMDLTFLPFHHHAKLMKIQNSLYIQTSSDIYYVIDLEQFM